jgi:hypothetical protein
MEMAPVIILDHLSKSKSARIYWLITSRLNYPTGMTICSRPNSPNSRMPDFELGDLGFSDDELRLLMADPELPDTDQPEETIPEPPAERGNAGWRYLADRQTPPDDRCEHSGVGQSAPGGGNIQSRPPRRLRSRIWTRVCPPWKR